MKKIKNRIVKKENGVSEQITASITITAIPDAGVFKSAPSRVVKLLNKAVEEKKVEVKKGLSYGEVEVIVSNSGRDRHGEIIQMEGINTKQVMKNPVLLWAHEYSNLPIGKILKLWKSNNNLMARVSLDYDIYDFADTVYKMILRGTINAVSIGGIVEEWDENDYSIIKKLEMVELSVVPVGAHPDALVVAKSLDMKPEAIKQQFEDFMRKSLVDKVKEMPQNELMSHIEALENLLSALKSANNDFADSEENTQESPEIKRVKLIVVRQAARQVDKQAEMVIAAATKKIKLIYKKN